VTIAAVVVVDNGSTDETATRAAAAGAAVIPEPRRGYGRACLTGAEAAPPVDLLVFMDGDQSEVPAELPLLLAPLLDAQADLVLGSRMGGAELGAITPQQRAGNAVASALLRLLYGVRVTDIPPYRVIRRRHLLDLGMTEMTYGWPTEMIARAAQRGLRVAEVPVTCRRRAGGVSKVSGNLRASVRTGYRMLRTIAAVRFGGGRPSEVPA
jgi:glycosyltransferase involved in cell wall biosynthesis